jgi:hypothetical protein
MARPRKWESDAERKAAKRAEQAAEEQYVARELAITAAQRPGDVERLERSERYLRWRFRAWTAGEVAYL